MRELPTDHTSHGRTDLQETANGSPNGIAPPAINLRAALHPDRGLILKPVLTDAGPGTTADELHSFVALGWPRDTDGRRHGEAHYDVEWLPVEVTVRFPETWLRRVREAQEQLAELDQDFGRIPLPPKGASPEERIRYWERVEAEHRFLAREQAVLAVLDAEAGDTKPRREWEAI